MFADILRQLMDLRGFYWVHHPRKQATRIYKKNARFTIGKEQPTAGDDVRRVPYHNWREALRRRRCWRGRISAGSDRYVHPQAY